MSLKVCICLYYIDDLQSVTFKMNKGKEDVQLPEDKIYKDKATVNPKKNQIVSKVRQYILQEYQDLYEKILNLPTLNRAIIDGDDKC